MKTDILADIIFFGIIGIFFLVFFLVVYSFRRARRNKKVRKKLLEEHKIAIASKKPINIANSNRMMINKFYDQHLLQHRMTFITTLFLASSGIIVILVGITLYFDEPEKKSISYLTAAGGIVIELITALLFRQNRSVTKQLNELHKKLIVGSNLENAISLAQNLPNEDKIKELRKIIKILLGQSTEQNSLSTDN